MVKLDLLVEMLKMAEDENGENRTENPISYGVKCPQNYRAVCHKGAKIIFFQFSALFFRNFNNIAMMFNHYIYRFKICVLLSYIMIFSENNDVAKFCW